MPTIREQILAGLKTTLVAAGITHVYRSRQSAFAREEGQATTIEWVTSPRELKPGGVCEYKLLVNIISIGRGAEPDSLLDARLAAIDMAVMADVRHGGLAVATEPLDDDCNNEDADLDVCIVTQPYRITFRTPINNPFVTA